MANYLEQVAHCPVYGNTRSHYYPLGDNCYSDILAALWGAKRYIFIEYFIIEEGKLWNSILDVLQVKVQQGVEEALGPVQFATGELADPAQDGVPVAFALGEDAEHDGGRRRGHQVLRHAHGRLHT